MHVKKKKPIRTFPDFARYGFTIRWKRKIVERKEKSSPLTPSIASNQYTPKIPICTKNVSWENKRKNSPPNYFQPRAFAYFSAEMTRDRQFLNVVEEPIFGEKIRRNVRNGIFSTKLAGQDGKREKGRGCSGNLFSHFPFSTFVASSTFRLHPSRFLSPVFPQKNRFACPPLHHARQHRREHAPAPAPES